MTLLSTRNLMQRCRIRGTIVPSTSTGLARATSHQYYYLSGAINHEKPGNPYPKFQYHWQQQQRSFAQQKEILADMTPQEMASLQMELLNDASYLTRALYRKCLQSIKLLAEANERDEEDFEERELQEKNQFSESGGGVDLERMSMAPPVNRQNELSSRANYYRQFTREHFDGHYNLLGLHGFHIGDEGNMTHGLGGSVSYGGGSNRGWNQYQGGHHHLGAQMATQYSGVGQKNDSAKGGGECIEHYMWREEQIEQFVYLIKTGEEKRQWILSDYEFEDPFRSSKDGWMQDLENRLENFEARSGSLVKEMYRRKGWRHSSDNEILDEDDDFFSDSDSDDDM